MPRLHRFLAVSLMLVGPPVRDARAEEGPGGGDPARKWGGALALNIPHPIWIEGDYRPSGTLSLAAGLGGLALKDLKFGTTPISVSIAALEIKGRWHPFRGAFFVGAGLGYQTMSGQMTEAITVQSNGQSQTVTTNLSLTVGSPFLAPQMGWFWVFGSGFLLGVDFGVQVPFSPRTTLDITTDNNNANVAVSTIQQTAQYRALEDKVQDAGNKLGKIPLPMITVLRVGWMF